VVFVTIVPDPGLIERLPRNVQRILLCERDEATAENIAADFSILLASRGYRLEPVVSMDPETVIAGSDEDSLILVAPRVWAALSEELRSHRRVFAADYVIEDGELTALGANLRLVATVTTGALLNNRKDEVTS